MAQIDHMIGIKAKADVVYKFLTIDSELSKWWTTDTVGAGDVGSVIKFRFNGGGPDFKVVQLEPSSVVRWEYVGGGPEAWSGSKISFLLGVDGEQTTVRFSHTDWNEVSDFMAHCSTKWAVFLLSLKEALETGIGKPFPNDVQIDHS